MSRGTLLFLWAVGALATAPARAGLTLTFQGRGATTTLRLEGEKVRVDEGEESFVFDGAARKLVTLSTGDHSYAVLTEGDLRAQGRRIRAELLARQGELVPEQRAQLEQLTRAGRAEAAPAPARAYLPTGRMERVAGLACEVHRHEHQGRTVEELCLAPWGPEAVRREDLAALERLSAFLGVLLEEIGPRAAGTLRTSRSNLVAMPGFAVRSAEIRADGKAVEEEVLVRLERGPLPASTFAVPDGYRRIGDR